MGPVELLAVTFPDAGMVASMSPVLDGIVASGHLRVVDAIVVARDGRGELVITDLDNDTIPAWSLLCDSPRPLISAEDATLLAEEIHGDEVGLIFVLEHLWPELVATLAADSGGIVQLHARIDPETVAVAAMVSA